MNQRRQLLLSTHYLNVAHSNAQKKIINKINFPLIFLKIYFSHCEILLAKSKRDKNKSNLLNIQIHKKKFGKKFTKHFLAPSERDD